MKEYRLLVPKRLALEATVQFAINMSELPKADKYILDFKNTCRIEPFALLYLSSEIQRCRSKHKEAEFEAINYQHCEYAAHMGFFKAFNLDYGKAPGEARGSSTYIPIKLFNTQNIIDKSKKLMINPAEFLEREAEDLSRILTQSESSDLHDVLVYAIREILRNIVEHSHSKQFGICAQYWPTYHTMSIAIIDRGVGIRKSLSANPNLNLENDDDVLVEALKPGVSGKIYKGQKRKPKGEWANSGYGLYMTSNICREGGSFFIASGNSGLYMSENKKRFLNTPFEGTVLNLKLRTDRIKPLNDILKHLRDTAILNHDDIRASVSSTNLRKDFPKK